VSSNTWQYAAKILQIIGAILGMWGASRMANQYTTNIRSALDVAEVLLNAVFRGDKAKGMISVAVDEDRLATVQGLGFVFLAFLLQLFGMLIDLFASQ
jgi:hypothetical protein